MTLRAKIILGIIAGLCLILVIFVGLWVFNVFKKSPLSDKINQKTEQKVQQQVGEQGEKIDQQPLYDSGSALSGAQPPVPLPEKLTGVVTPFVDRFGTYSNQANYDNLEALLPFMTQRLKEWSQNKIDESKKKPFPKEYFGVTTKSLTPNVISIDDKEGRAEIKVSTQRTESVGTQSNAKVYNQDIVIKLVKDDTMWLIDSAEWK